MEPRGGFEPPTYSLREQGNGDINEIVSRFKEFCIIDKCLAKRTAKHHENIIHKFLSTIGKAPSVIDDSDVRAYLASFKDKSPHTYRNILKSLRVFFRDFMQRPEVIQTFRFPYIPVTIKSIPTKEQLQTFYSALKTPKHKAIFLFYATTGLRRTEVLHLTRKDIDLEERTVIPSKNGNRTKHAWVSFFNEECKQALEEYLSTRKDTSPRLFPFECLKFYKMWKEAREETGLDITPQVLREWFACELGRLGVPDRYVDAFCGRVPRSILARHYTDFSPERLKEIYDKAKIRMNS